MSSVGAGQEGTGPLCLPPLLNRTLGVVDTAGGHQVRDNPKTWKLGLLINVAEAWKCFPAESVRMWDRPALFLWPLGCVWLACG